jgi:hypothetical protein
MTERSWRARYPAAVETPAAVPCSDVGARMILEMAGEADRLVAGLLPEARSTIRAALAGEERQGRLAESARALDHLANGELVEEVLRLDAEGLLGNKCPGWIEGDRRPHAGAAGRCGGRRGRGADAGPGR